MAYYMALHDVRLMGGVPARPDLGIIKTDASTSLYRAFNAIRAQARGKRVHSLFVLCHGYAGSNPRKHISMDAGGMGLELGHEGVFHDNVSMWSAIAGSVDNIVIYSCAAANTEPGNVGTEADGRYLMGAIAINARATVYAADRIQWYTIYQGLKHGRMDFGAWEGALWSFPPNGAFPTLVRNPPVEFGQVMAGIAP